MEISELTAGVEDSSALPRITGPAKDFVRGSLHSRPFHPGGLDGSQSLPRVVPDGSLNGDWTREVLEGGSAEKAPPSFRQGLDFGNLKVNWVALCLKSKVQFLVLRIMLLYLRVLDHLIQNFMKKYSRT